MRHISSLPEAQLFSLSPSQAGHTVASLPVTECPRCPSRYIECPGCPLHYPERPHCLYVVGSKKGQSLPILPMEQGHVCWALARTQSQIVCLSKSCKTSQAPGKWQALCTWKSSALSQESQGCFRRRHIPTDHWKSKSINARGATSWEWHFMSLYCWLSTYTFKKLSTGVLLLFFLVSKWYLTLLQPHELQAPLPMGFLRQEYWSELPFPSSGGLPDPGIKPASPALQEDSSPLSHQRSPNANGNHQKDNK